MENYNKVIELAKQIIKQNEALEVKPTKAERARLRKSLNELKKLVTPAKSELIDQDKS